MSENLFVAKSHDQRIKILTKTLKGLGETVVDSDHLLAEDKRLVYLLAPSERVTLENIEEFRKNSTIFCGKADSEIIDRASSKNLLIYQYLSYGQFITKNAILTAKSLILTILKWEKSEDKNVKILVVGFGNVGRAVVEVLRPYYKKIDVLSRTPEKVLFYADAVLKSQCDLGNYDLIISTVPTHVFGEEELGRIRADCKLIELASPPYSFDTEVADRLKINYQILPSLPSKEMPYQAAELMLEVIRKVGVIV